MSLLQERAEDLDFLGLDRLRTIQQGFSGRLLDYLFSEEKRPIFVPGPKGSGKTFKIMKGLSEAVKTNERFVPAMFVFKQRNRLELLDPAKIAPKEVWGNRFGLYSNDREDILRQSSAIVVDDFHWVFEAIAKKEYDPNKLVSFLRGVLNYVDSGKKAILISEDLPNFYTRGLGLKEFDDIWPRFGLHPQAFCDNVYEWEKASEKIDYLALREVPRYSFDEWCEVIDNYNVKVEQPIDRLLYELNPKPRAFVRFANIYQPKSSITVTDINEKALELLRGRVDKWTYDFYKFLLDFPLFKTYTDVKYFNQILAATKGIENLKKFSEVIDNIVDICAESAKVLPPCLDRDGNLDVKRTLKTNYKKDPIATQRILQEFITTDVPEANRDNANRLIGIYIKNQNLTSTYIYNGYNLLKNLERIIELKLNSRGSSLKEEKNYFDHLIRNISKYYFEGEIRETVDLYGDRIEKQVPYWILYRPYQLAFIHILIEKPSLEIISSIKSL